MWSMISREQVPVTAGRSSNLRTFIDFVVFLATLVLCQARMQSRASFEILRISPVETR